MLGIPKKTLVIGAILFGVALIYTTGSEQRASEAESDGASGKAAVQCRVTVTADVLNVRSGPGTDTEIVGKFRQDTETAATTQVRNGFRKIGDNRWAFDEFLQPVEGADCG